MSGRPDAPNGLNGRELITWRLKQLEKDVEELRAELRSANNWLRGILGTLVISLGLLIVQFIGKLKGS